MSSTTYLLNEDTPPYIWAGKYDSILRYGGNKFPLINEVRDILSGSFRIRLKISNIGSNLYVNGKPCLVRKHKFAPITIYSNTVIIEGTDAGSGGSNSYPHISFKEKYAIVDVITDGFPHLDLQLYNMKIDILALDRV